MHAVLQRCFLTHSLSGGCFELPSLSPSTVLHLTKLNIILIVTVARKGGVVRRAEARYITAVFIQAVYYAKKDLVASKRKVKKNGHANEVEANENYLFEQLIIQFTMSIHIKRTHTKNNIGSFYSSFGDFFTNNVNASVAYFVHK